MILQKQPGNLDEYKRSFIFTWYILSTIILLIIMAPYFVRQATLLNILPTCSSKVTLHKECSLCGMTHAFISLSKFDINSAYEFNRGSIFLYSVFAINGTCFILYLIGRTKNILITIITKE